MDSWYTTKKDRSFYGLYFMGQNAVYTFTYMFLATYLLLCGLDAVSTAGVLLVVKIWDAVNDCLFGGLIDKFHFKKGRFVPWLKISLPLISSVDLRNSVVNARIRMAHGAKWMLRNLAMVV